MAEQELTQLADSAKAGADSLQKLLGTAGAAKQKEELARLDAATGIQNFGPKLNIATTVLQGVAKVAGEYYQAMASGQKGYAAMNAPIDAAADALTAIGAAVMALSGPLGLLIGGVGLVVKAGSKYVKASAEQSDKLYDSYRTMSQVGATGAAGLQAIYSDMQKLGLGIQDLDKMAKLITENGKDLALLGGSASTGRQKFAAASEVTNQYRISLMRLGMSQDDINEGIASYIRLETKLGTIQQKSFSEMGESARQYILERNALAKVTGLTLKEQEKALEEVRSQEMFRGKLQELIDQGKFNEAKELETTYLNIRSVNTTAAQGFADIATGNLRTEAAQKEMRVSQGKTMEVIDKISNNQMKSAEAADEVAQAHTNTANAMGISLAKTGNYNKVMGDFAGDMKLKAKLLAGGFVKAKKDSDIEITKQVAGVDKEVVRQADLIDAQRQAMNATQDFVRAGVGPATKIVKGFNDVLGSIAKKVLPGRGAGAAPTPTPAAPPQATRPQAPVAAPTAPAAPAAPAPAAPAPAAPAPAVPIPLAPGAPRPTAPPAAAAPPPKRREELDVSGEAKNLVDRLRENGITNPFALAAIVATAKKESGLDYKKEESGSAEYLATLDKRGLSYIYKVFPQLGPNGRVANALGYGNTGVPADVIKAEWSKGDEPFFNMVYGGLNTNKNAGDAFKYRGRGYVQITGRSVYEKVGKEVGLNLVDDPDSITKDRNVAAAALAGYLYLVRGGKANALKSLNEFKSNDEALKYVLRSVAGLGHKEAEFDKKDSHLYHQFEKSVGNLGFAESIVNGSKVPSARDGGIFRGPKSGYAAKLHGEELIAPLDKSSDLMMVLEKMRSTNALILESIHEISSLQQMNTAVDRQILKKTI